MSTSTRSPTDWWSPYPINSMEYHPGHGSCRNVGGKPCPACLELLEVARGITEASLKIVELYQKQHELKSKLNQFHDPVVRSLPVEIVSRIFELCLPPHELSVHVRDMNVSPEFSPLRFGAVCRAWRDIAWATPQLWNFLSIHINSKLITNREDYSIVRGWLERSGALPLSIRMYNFTGLAVHDFATFRNLDFIIDLVNKYSPRCHDLDLALPASLLDRIADLSQLTPKNLRVKVTNTAISRTRLYALKTWDTLTTWNASHIYTDDVLNVLMNAPRLTECALHHVRRRPQLLRHRTRRARPFTHDSLSHIKFEPSELEATVIFRDLTLPALHRLGFSWWNPLSDVWGSIFNRITSCIKRSSSPLEILCLNLPEAPSSMIVPLLHSFPQLVQLELWGPFRPDMWSTLFGHIRRPCLGSSSSDDVLLPRLRFLTLGHPKETGPYSGYWDGIIDTLEDTLADRNSIFRKGLEGITIMYAEDDRRGPRFYREHVFRLAGLIQAGVPVKIAWNKPGRAAIYLNLIKFRDLLIKRRVSPKVSGVK